MYGSGSRTTQIEVHSRHEAVRDDRARILGKPKGVIKLDERRLGVLVYAVIFCES